MSWFQSVSHIEEDVFDEDGDELSLQSKEWISNMRKRTRDGYVDGIDAGEDAALQPGFKQGFIEGAAQTVAVGRLKGIISAIWCWCQIQHPEKPLPASVTDLLHRVSQYEDTITEGFRKALENPPPSVSDVSESMEDLKVDQADPGCCGEGCKEGNCCSGEGCKEGNCCSGEGCKEGNCCSRGEKMDLDLPHPPQKLSSVSSVSSFSSGESLHNLLQRCMDLVLEFGLPQELLSHIQELKNI